MKDNSSKVILDLCGGDGSWSLPYARAGYRVLVVDMMADLDVRTLPKIKKPVYGILAAPPCTHLSASGSKHWDKKGPEALLNALAVVDACCRIILINRPRAFWAIENPKGRISTYLGKPTMTFQPCDYGDPYTKFTCLWGEFNEPQKTPIEPKEGSKMQNAPHDQRRRYRSITPPGFARAFFMANQ